MRPKCDHKYWQWVNPTEQPGPLPDRLIRCLHCGHTQHVTLT